MGGEKKTGQKQDTKSDWKFAKSTKYYDLQVLFDKQNLQIILKDYVSNCHFQKTYTESDIGNQISRKMELQQVFQCFSLSKRQQNINLNSQPFQIFSDQLIDQEMCQLTLNQQKIKCHTINKNGKISVFLTVTNNMNHQTNCYQSVLQLQQIRNLTDIQLIKKQTNNKCDEKFKRLEKMYLQQQQIINKQKTDNQNAIKELLKYQQLQNNKLKILNSQQKSLKLKQKNSSYFAFNNNILTFNGSNWRHFYFGSIITANKKYEFSIKILKTQDACIFIGIGNYDKNKQQQFSNDSICYCGSGGSKWPVNIQQGSGYKQNDTVTVKVDYINCLVQWFVNDKKEASHKFDMLNGNLRAFMPFVQMCDKQDTVQLLYFKQI